MNADIELSLWAGNTIIQRIDVAVNFDIADSGYSIRPAKPADAKALRMLLPGMGNTAVYLVAVDGRHQLVIGAAVATNSFRRHPLAGPGIAVHVIEPCRRHGIGRDLIDQLTAAAKTMGALALYAAKRVELDGDERRGWQRLGFTICETVEQHRMSLAKIEPKLTPLLKRINDRGRVPPTAQVIPLYKADLQAVLQLHLDILGGDRADLDRRLRGRSPNAFLPQHSKVLVVDDKVKGCILGHRKDAQTILIDAVMVDPSLRGGWANVWLKLEGLRGIVPLGVKNVEFTTFSHYADTLSFMKKLGGVTTGRSALMYRPLKPNDAHGSDVAG